MAANYLGVRERAVRVMTWISGPVLRVVVLVVCTSISVVVLLETPDEEVVATALLPWNVGCRLGTPDRLTPLGLLLAAMTILFPCLAIPIGMTLVVKVLDVTVVRVWCVDLEVKVLRVLWANLHLLVYNLLNMFTVRPLQGPRRLL